MAMWRIRINLSDDPRSRERLNEVLSRQQVSAIRLTPRAGTDAELAGDVVLELPRDDELGEMLTALHTISPQVYVSRASHDDPSMAALAGGLAATKPDGEPTTRGEPTAHSR